MPPSNRRKPRRRPRAGGSTIHDVAKRAAVSTATVSRTFSGTAIVRAPTRERVLAAARAVHYRPNRAARSLVTGIGGTFAMVVPDLARPAHAALAGAAARRARESGHLLAVADCSSDQESERGICENLALRAEGILLCAPKLSIDEVQALAETTPVVLAHRRLGSIPAVLTSERALVAKAAGHLRDLGHREIALVSGPQEPTEAKERATAVEALEGMQCIHVSANGADFSEGVALASTIAALGVTATIAFDDGLALGIVSGLREAGVDVPRQIGVIAACDHPAMRMARPALTTVAPPTDDMGAAAIDLLLMATRGGAEAAALRTVRFGPRLVIRGSTRR